MERRKVLEYLGERADIGSNFNYSTALASVGRDPKAALSLLQAANNAYDSGPCNTGRGYCPLLGAANFFATMGDVLTVTWGSYARQSWEIDIQEDNPEYSLDRILGTVTGIVGTMSAPGSGKPPVGRGALVGGGEAAGTQAVPKLRQQYVDAVEALRTRVAGMREAGASSEEIARFVHAERRALGVQYKSLTPPDFLAQIYERNLARYGDKLGPTIEWLRGAGKTWDDIIESALRPGGKDLGL